MSNPTMPLLAEATAEALSNSVDTRTGLKHQKFDADENNTPSAFSRLMNLEDGIMAQLAPCVQGLVVDLDSGLDVGAFAAQYPVGGTAYGFVGDDGYTLPASETCHVYLDASGVLEHSITGWPGADHFKLAIVTTDATTVTGVSDARMLNFQNGVLNNWWAHTPTADADLDGQGLVNLGTLAGQEWIELTIASGAVAPTQMLHSVDTEADAASDDLTDLAVVAGQRRLVLLSCMDAARVVTVKDSGNITLLGGDLVLDSVNKIIGLLQDDDSGWTEVFRNVPTLATLTATLDANGQRIDDVGALNLKRTDLTISGGSVTVTGSYHRVDTEGMAAEDNLDGIVGGQIGDILVLEAVATGRHVYVRHGLTNIRLASGQDYKLEAYRQLVLVFNGIEWVQSAPGAITLLDLVPSVRAVPYPLTAFLGGALSVKVYEQRIHCPVHFTIKDARGDADTAPSGGACIIDIRVDGNSIFADQSEMINIADGTHSDLSATKNLQVAAGSIITIECEAANSAQDVGVAINGYTLLMTPPA